MRGYVQLDPEGRVLVASEAEEYVPDGIETELPDDIFNVVCSYYIYRDGKLIFSPPLPTKEELEEQKKYEEREKFLENGPSQLADIDDILCGLYETNLELQYQINQLGGDIL